MILGITGGSGCGKTTLLRLLKRELARLEELAANGRTILKEELS